MTPSTFFDGYKAKPRLCAPDVGSRLGGWGGRAGLVRYQRRNNANELEEILKIVKAHTSTPLGIHCHNDAGMAAANSVLAVANGIVHVQGTMNGYGERSGMPT